MTAPLRPALHACGDDVPGHTNVRHTGEAVSRHGLRRDEADAATASAHKERTHLRRLARSSQLPPVLSNRICSGGDEIK